MAGVKSLEGQTQFSLGQIFTGIMAVYIGFFCVTRIWPSGLHAFALFNSSMQVIFDVIVVSLSFHISRYGRKSDRSPFNLYLVAFLFSILADGFHGIAVNVAGINSYGGSGVDLGSNLMYLFFLTFCFLGIQSTLEGSIHRNLRRQVFQKPPFSQKVPLLVGVTYFVMALFFLFPQLIENFSENGPRIVHIVCFLANGLLMGYAVVSVASSMILRKTVGETKIAHEQAIGLGFLLVVLFGFFVQVIEICYPSSAEFPIETLWLGGKLFIVFGFVHIGRVSVRTLQETKSA